MSDGGVEITTAAANIFEEDVTTAAPGTEVVRELADDSSEAPSDGEIQDDDIDSFGETTVAGIDSEKTTTVVPSKMEATTVRVISMVRTAEERKAKKASKEAIEEVNANMKNLKEAIKEVKKGVTKDASQEVNTSSRSILPVKRINLINDFPGDEKQHKCPYCSDLFKTAVGLGNHKRSHKEHSSNNSNSENAMDEKPVNGRGSIHKEASVMEEENGLKEHVTPPVKISEEGQVNDNAGVKLKAPEEQIVKHEGKEKEIPSSDPFDFDAEQCDRDNEQVKMDILVEELIKDEEVIEADVTDMAEEFLKEVKDNEVKVDDSSHEEGMNLDMPSNNPKQTEEGQKPENKEEANKPEDTGKEAPIPESKPAEEAKTSNGTDLVEAIEVIKDAVKKSQGKSAVTDESKLVTAISSNSQAGVIQTLLVGQGEDEEKRSVLHGKLVRLAKQIAAVAAGVALVTLGVLVIRQVMVEKTEKEAKTEQQCRTVSNQQCTTVNEQQCQTGYETECNTVQKQQCTTVQEQQCSVGSRQECNTVNKQQWENTFETQCNTVQERECSLVNKEQCTTVNEEQCRTVQEQQCSTVQEQQCRAVQEEVCRATSRQECNTVNKQVCETQYDNVCNTIQDQECTTVHSAQCTVHSAQCQTVNEQQCSTVHDTVQEKAKAYMAHVMTAVTMLVVAIPEGLPMAVTLALARELLCQAVAYNSSYSSRLEERDGLDTQGDIEQEEEQKQELKEQQRALCGRRTGEDEVGANSANGGHDANDDEHSEQAEACDAGDENAGDDGDENAGEIEEEQDKNVQGGTASEEAVNASHANRVADAIKQE